MGGIYSRDFVLKPIFDLVRVCAAVSVTLMTLRIEDVPITIGTNINSLRALGELSKSTDALSSVFQRLSSGVRIHQASDDPAGLALATKLSLDARVLSQGARNISDGISVFAVFESALTALSSILYRQNELATQASNGSLSDAQREVLDEEAQALIEEYNRIVTTTVFNDTISLAAGGEISIQAGNSSIRLTLPSIAQFTAVPTEILIGDGTFAAAISYATGGETSFATADSLADLNNDGFLDLITPDSTGGNVMVMLGLGDGSFGAATALTADTDISSITTGDFNGDGKIDIAASAGGNDSVYVFLGVGDGTFSAATTLLDAGGVTVVRSGDVNGDGDLDLVVVDNYANGAGALRVYIGNGNGTFAASVSYNGDPTFSDGMILVDVNHDGRLDVLTAHNAGYVGVSFGNVDGSFSARVTYVDNNGPTNLTSADVDGDGNVDIIVADFDGDSISVLLGNANGTFNAAVSFVAGDQAYYVAAGDFDGDEVIDLVSIDRGTGDVSVFIGNGNGTFQARQTYAIFGISTTVLVGDFNEDGVSDLFVLGYSGQSANILLGNSTTAMSTGEYSIATQSSALTAIDTIESYLTALQSEQGKVSAAQSRLSYALSATEVAAENYRAAEARIRDADVAQDVAEMVRLQILQQAQTAILAQANLESSLVLKLLK